MTDHAQYMPGPASGAQFWCDHLDALERHLSAKMWALATIPVVLAAYPIARIVMPAVLHAVVDVVPDVVRTVLNLI